MSLPCYLLGSMGNDVIIKRKTRACKIQSKEEQGKEKDGIVLVGYCSCSFTNHR